MSDLNRRTFLSAAAGTVATASLANRASAQGPNDTVRAAILGVNGRGKAHMEGFTGTKRVKVAVLCDPDQKVLDARLSEFEKKYGYRPEGETDLRKVYDRKDVDVVSVATPTTGTPSRRSGPVRPARTSMSRSRGATTFLKAGRWSKRPRSMAGSFSTGATPQPRGDPGGGRASPQGGDR